MLLSHLQVAGHSMQPTINPGDHLIATSLPYFFKNPKLSDIVVLKHPQTHDLLVKRITKMDNGRCRVVGDNPNDSLDSRSFGWVDKREILAKVVYIHHIK